MNRPVQKDALTDLRPRVVYTDPMWALTPDGQLDRALANIESGVFGDDIGLDINPPVNGSYATTGSEFLDYLAGASGLVIYRTQITEEVLEAIQPDCYVIARQGVGTDNLNIPLLQRSGLQYFNLPDYCVEEVTSHTLALLLALERGVCTQDALIRAGQWGIHLGGVPRRLNRLTLGIVGFGRIGRATARKAAAFYGQIKAFDPYVAGDLIEGYGVTPCSSLGALLSESDAVVLHCDLNDETKHMINPDTLPAIRPGAMLVNTARGGLVDPRAILALLKSGQLGGYASDVFTPEDPNADPINAQILTHRNTAVTCHRAFLSVQSEYSQRLRVAEKMRSILMEKVTASPPLGVPTNNGAKQ